MQIIQSESPKDLATIMRQIKVDPYGIKIMAPKGIRHLIKINRIPNIAANILKQEMLSLGGEVAVSRAALTGKEKSTDCLLMGNLSQINRLNKKLNHQPFGLSRLAEELEACLANYARDNFVLDLGRHKLRLDRHALVMGILNLTPDSFSADGLLAQYATRITQHKIAEIVEYAETMVKDGADIIDVGGESSRPGAKPVKLKEELARTIPVIKLLAKRLKVPISIDTYKPQVAQAAVDNGAVIINDISGLKDARMARLASRTQATVVIMHMRGNPLTMRKMATYDSLIEEIITFLKERIERALIAGLGKEKIIIDPGIGFAKTFAQNLEILKRLKEFKVLGRPILVGPSRKSFIGKILNTGPQERLPGTVASCILAVQNGAKLLRVHDIKKVKQALLVQEAINNS